MNNSKRRVVIAGIVGFSLVAAACGEDEGAGDAPTTPAPAETGVPTETDGPSSTEGGGELELAGGEVFVTGSSTVEPISVLVSELADELSGGQLAVTVEGPGTGDGFQKFCAGEADVSDASRKIKDEEAQLCADAGIEFVELEIGIDGLTVATSPNNTAVECLDPAALYALLGPEAEGFENWSDASTIAAELGSAHGEFPDAPLDITGPGPESGTYDTFVEFAIAKPAEERGQDATTRPDYTQSPNDNLIVEGIEGSDSSLGWIGFAFYKAEQDRMKAIGIDTGDGCVLPSAEAVADGTYPFSRSLYIYVSTQSMADNPAVASFVDLYLSDQGIAEVTEAGYVALPGDRLEATRAAWSGAAG
ncbi:MAG TPA: substrate-binding domain-containing protein [Ilumatobacteraceae bacterium]|nr:substrate-binding domain-containing protein [Ilumatobacteraceae bacterium]